MTIDRSVDRRELVDEIRKWGPAGISLWRLEAKFPTWNVGQRVRNLACSPPTRFDPRRPVERVIVEPRGGARARVKVVIVHAVDETRQELRRVEAHA